MMEIEPITRQEAFMNAVATGKSVDLEPITREEMFLAKAGGQNVTTPQPITRREMFLSKISGSSGGGGEGGDEGWIGDGNTHIWISLAEGRTSPMLGVCPKGTVTVDWGDGTTPDVLTGTNDYTLVWTPTHEYGKAGEYVITLTVDGEAGLSGVTGSNQGACILRHSSEGDWRNRTYTNALRKVEIGNGIKRCVKASFNSCSGLTSITIPNGVTSIGDYTFTECYSLTSISIPDSVTSIGNSAFASCACLTSITIPDGVTDIGSSDFASCVCLTSVSIPGSVTSIGSMAFYNNYGMCYYDFTKHTAVPTLSNTNAFNNIPADCEIRVPAALYDEWIAATNWATYASYIKAV